MTDPISELAREVHAQVEAECLRYAAPDTPGAGSATEADTGPLTFPGHIIKGAAGNFADVLSDCMEPPRHFFFLAYLTCLGAVLAGRVTLNTELKPQPRPYTVLLGESADDRKSTAIHKTVDFFTSALTSFECCFGVGSAEGLQKRFQKNSDAATSSLLLVFDELKAFVGKSKVDGSVLLPCVCTLFETNRYESHTKNREVILTNAALSILAASTVETYERCWDSAFQDIGMTNRLFIVPGQGRRKHAIPCRVPYQEWELMRGELGKILRLADGCPELDFTPAARSLYESWYFNLEQSVHTKRLDTYALRFMILLSINNGAYEVDELIVQDVIDLMNWQLEARRLHDPIDADSKIASLEEKIRRKLKAPLTNTELKRAVHYERQGIALYQQAIKNLTNEKEIRFNKTTNKWERV
jgi:hypothetical protein